MPFSSYAASFEREGLDDYRRFFPPAADEVCVDLSDKNFTSTSFKQYIEEHPLSNPEKITTLQINGNNIGREGLDYLTTLPLTSLRFLDISYTEIGNDSVPFLGRISSLLYVNLSGNSLSVEGIASLRALTTLEGVALNHCGLYLEDLDPLSLDHLSAPAQNLKYLWVKGNRLGKSNPRSSSSVYKLPHINTLILLDASDNPHGGGVFHLLEERVGNLKWLDVSSSTQEGTVNPKAAIGIARLELSYLNLNGNSLLGKDGLQIIIHGVPGIAEGAHNLEELYLAGCGSPYYYTYPGGHRHTLQRSGELNIGDSLISDLVNLSKLRKLDLSNNDVGSDGAAYLLEHAASLQEVNLANNLRISESIRRLLKEKYSQKVNF